MAFHLQVIEQERTVLDTFAESIVAPGEAGYLGVLTDHAPLISTLGRGRLAVETRDGQKLGFDLRGGFLEVLDNEVSVLADAIDRPEGEASDAEDRAD